MADIIPVGNAANGVAETDVRVKLNEVIEAVNAGGGGGGGGGLTGDTARLAPTLLLEFGRLTAAPRQPAPRPHRFR